MLKIKNKNNEVSYILTEEERGFLISDEAKILVEEKNNNINKYADTNVDFFTDKEVPEENKWLFNVEKDGIIYTCVYNNEDEPDNLIEQEVKALVKWYFDDKDGKNSYIEIIGNFIFKEKIWTRSETGYNECREYIEKYNKGENTCEYEEIELNDLNKNEVRKFMGFCMI